MRHVRMLGACLVVALAIAAVVSSSASALPEWGKCVKAGPGGKYADANCTVKAKKGAGEYTWKKGNELAPVKFTGESIGSGGVLYSSFTECYTTYHRETRAQCEAEGDEVVETPPFEQITIECEKENATGEATGSKSVANVKVTFKGCDLLHAGPCTTKGAAAGEIKTNILKGSLGYINKSAKEVGVLLEPAQKKGTFAEFVCLGSLNTVVGVGNKKEGAAYSPESHGGYDGIISPITPVNTMTSKYEQVYTTNLATTQNVPSKFEGKHTELLEDYIEDIEDGTGSMWQKAAEEITNVNTPAEPGEIKA